MLSTLGTLALWPAFAHADCDPGLGHPTWEMTTTVQRSDVLLTITHWLEDTYPWGEEPDGGPAVYPQATCGEALLTRDGGAVFALTPLAETARILQDVGGCGTTVYGFVCEYRDPGVDVGCHEYGLTEPAPHPVYDRAVYDRASAGVGDVECAPIEDEVIDMRTESSGCSTAHGADLPGLALGVSFLGAGALALVLRRPGRRSRRA